MFGEKVFYTISEQIVHQIKRDIFNGKLIEGESLKEVQMAQKYNVSRGPIRDALKLLAKEGFLVSRPNVGVTVAPAPSDEVINEVIELRRHVEVFALTNCIDNLTDEDIMNMKMALEKMNEASKNSDLNELINFDMSFHSIIIKRYDERHLYGIWNDLVFRMMFNYNRLADLNESCKEHDNILKAIEDKDLKLAIELLRNNIQ
ncbi:MAG: GntR family transcriptional regulator [Spirochaetaceae bacterium]